MEFKENAKCIGIVEKWPNCIAEMITLSAKRAAFDKYCDKSKKTQNKTESLKNVCVKGSRIIIVFLIA